MPNYDYQCSKCGTTEEMTFRIADALDTTVCSNCGSLSRRLISAPAISTDTPRWINQALRDHIQGDGERPIETRRQLSEYCKAKDIVPCS